jgi:hypothetical protein
MGVLCNGARTEYTYFGSGAVKKISHLSTTGTLIASAEYDYDLAGNVLSVVFDDGLRYSGDATVSYSYDDLHRLTEETCVPAQGSYRVPYHYRYSYDAVGNRTGKTIGSGIGRLEITYSYSVRNELVDEETYQVIWNEEEQEEEEEVYLSGWSYSYDLRGNMVRKGDPEGHWWWEYTWSADDKLLKMEFIDDYGSEGPRTKVEYKYDLLGRRIAKRVTPAYGTPGPWRWYFYDGLQVTAEGTGTTDKMYYTHSPSAIGGIIARDNNGQKLWYHFDRLGNVMAVTDSNGNMYPATRWKRLGVFWRSAPAPATTTNSAPTPNPITSPPKNTTPTPSYSTSGRDGMTPRQGDSSHQRLCRSSLTICIVAGTQLWLLTKTGSLPTGLWIRGSCSTTSGVTFGSARGATSSARWARRAAISLPAWAQG